MSNVSAAEREVLRSIAADVIKFVGAQQAWKPFTIEQTEQLLTWKTTLDALGLVGPWDRLNRRLILLIDVLVIAQCVTLVILGSTRVVRRELSSLTEELS